jgi:lipopolysaccharide transport system permease protein
MSKLTVDAEKSKFSLNLGELVQYRDLLFTLAYRDIRVRYTQTFLGMLWAIFQPLVTLIIITVIFGKAIKVDTGGIPYPLFAVVGVAAWTYFAYTLGQASSSIISSQDMIKKIYFPRLVVPLSKALVGLIDFGVGLAFVLVLMVYYGWIPGSTILWLPLVLLINILAALGIGFWFSALSIRYRDVQHIIPFIVQLGFYATPVAYSAGLVPGGYKLLYFLNPMAGVIEGYRYALFGSPFEFQYAAISLFIAVFLFISGLVFFQILERKMADIL